MFGYADIYSCCDQIPMLLQYHPIGLEGFDDGLIDDQRKKGLHKDEVALFPEGRGWLIVEFGGNGKEEANGQARKLMERLKSQDHSPAMRLSDDPAQEALIWSVRESALLTKLGLDYQTLDSGCCGMAGAFGFEKGHYAISMQIGKRVLLPAVRQAEPETLIIADGFSCREQIEQSTDRYALHLAQVIQMALHEGQGGATGEGDEGGAEQAKPFSVTGVSYFDSDGNERELKAKVVIVSGYAIETPRLLLNSACPGFENGLANSSGTVGKYLMVQIGNVVLARFEDPVRMYKAPPAHALTEEFYETDPKRDFARGFAIQTVGPLPIAFSKQMLVAKSAWGWGMRRVMMDYNHWAALGVLGEILPWEENRVTLADETDHYGLRVAKVTFRLHDNDKKVAKAGVEKTTEIMYAAGAQEVVEEPRYAHLVGGARMGNDPRTSVTDSFGRTHDIANLFVCDGSLLPTQGSANPGLTIQALAARTADYIISNGKHLLSDYPETVSVAHPPARQNMSPAGTANKGVPRIK
ncbi:GMC oxidoreductase [Reticulibacter mediterranei]|uniref:GMC oxidoreductase n=1 Tax=Reticulibacter mediterranei TaxID=2778369 RepID=UPI003570C30C